MNGDMAALFEHGEFVRTAELLAVMTRQQLDVHVRNGRLVRVWYGVYAVREPDLFGRLAALDVFLGRHAVACMGTAAALYGFDTEAVSAVHILDPGIRVRSKRNLVVHQRLGAPLQQVQGRTATAPAWTAIELSRALPRRRALATLDLALRTQLCRAQDLEEAVRRQRGRRGIVKVRYLLPHADPRAESAMESEARLVMIDRGVPTPELQFEICGPEGQLWRVDFAWPDARVVAEYDSVEWHAGRMEMLRDKARFAGLQELGWTVIPIVADDVRRSPDRLASRIMSHLDRAAA